MKKNQHRGQKPLLILALITCFFVIGIKGCSWEQKMNLTPLKIGMNRWPGFDIVLYAQQKELFKKRGLDIELVLFDNAQDTVRALMRGSFDLAFVSLGEVLQADPGNDSPVFLMVTNISAGADGIVGTSQIKSVADLVGKKVGAKLASVNHVILLEALKTYQIQPEKVTIDDITNEFAVEKLKEGALDAAVIWEPHLSQTAQAIKGNIIFTTKDVDSLVVDGLAGRTSFVKSHQKEITQFLLTWFDLMAAVENNPQDVFTVVSQQLGQTPETFAQDYAGLKKGDIAMNQRMFGSENRLANVLKETQQLLESDPRHGRVIRQDVTLNSELVITAIQTWKP